MAKKGLEDKVRFILADLDRQYPATYFSSMLIAEEFYGAYFSSHAGSCAKEQGEITELAGKFHLVLESMVRAGEVESAFVRSSHTEIEDLRCEGYKLKQLQTKKL